MDVLALTWHTAYSSTYHLSIQKNLKSQQKSSEILEIYKKQSKKSTFSRIFFGMEKEAGYDILRAISHGQKKSKLKFLLSKNFTFVCVFLDHTEQFCLKTKILKLKFLSRLHKSENPAIAKSNFFFGIWVGIWVELEFELELHCIWVKGYPSDVWMDIPGEEDLH